jgi:hypothetical protein
MMERRPSLPTPCSGRVEGRSFLRSCGGRELDKGALLPSRRDSIPWTFLGVSASAVWMKVVISCWTAVRSWKEVSSCVGF